MRQFEFNPTTKVDLLFYIFLLRLLATSASLHRNATHSQQQQRLALEVQVQQQLALNKRMAGGRLTELGTMC